MFAIIAALVHLVPGDMAVELRIGFLLRYVTGDPVLDPGKYLFNFVFHLFTIDNDIQFWIR